ncbi:MAG TPA: membrane protein insertase YidC [Terracidiphilus sp.]
MPEYQNPNLQTQGGGPSGGGGGGDSKSLLYFGLLAILVFFGFQYFFKPKPPTPSQQTQTQAASPESQAASPQGPAGPPATTGGKAPAAGATPVAVAANETQTTVENADYRITFSNRGAQVQHWVLKHYFDSTGKPLDMVQEQASQRFGFPLSLFTYDQNLTTELNQALYQASAVGNLTAPAGLSFHYSRNGVDVVKTFRFGSGYVIAAEVQVKRDGQPVRALLQWPAGLGDMEEFVSQTRGHAVANIGRTPSQFVWSIAGRADTETGNKVSNNNTLEGDYDYAASADLYFAAAFLPDVPERTTVVTLHHAIELPTDPSNPNSEKKPADVLGLAMGDTSGDTRLRLYAGPKQMDILAGIRASGPDGKHDGPSLESLIQFGWLTVIAKPLFLALRFLYRHLIPNWGWDIILFTVLFNVLLLPTRLMMMKSSLKMMRIQPKVEALKKKYAHLKINDPKRTEMNTEMMALYKTEGVNMYGGCLPMLLQMPLFFAYFRVLQNTVELRQAHWMWLHDLAAPDPLHILPIIIIVTMLVTQLITPSPGMDPNQRRMMAIMMPAIFGFTLWQYASGLALYWGTGNIIMMAMQIAINRSHIGKEMHAIATKRAAKKAGVSPKTISGRR